MEARNISLAKGDVSTKHENGMISYWDESGEFGFISKGSGPDPCQIMVLKRDLMSVGVPRVGRRVKFILHLNIKGQLEARSVQPAEGGDGSGSGSFREKFSTPPRFMAAAAARATRRFRQISAIATRPASEG